jgi:hypothetical protein
VRYNVVQSSVVLLGLDVSPHPMRLLLAATERLMCMSNAAHLAPALQVDTEVAAALASVSELIFFILGAMTIVEVRTKCHLKFTVSRLQVYRCQHPGCKAGTASG